MNTTKSPWIVTPTDIKQLPGYDFVAVCTVDDTVPAAQITKVVAITGINTDKNPDLSEDIANAALIAAAPELLEALIEVQAELNTSKQTIDLNKLNDIVSAAIEKIAAESGEAS
jgi:hypothetical protein